MGTGQVTALSASGQRGFFKLVARGEAAHVATAF